MEIILPAMKLEISYIIFKKWLKIDRDAIKQNWMLW